jgi:hypothetical protein
MTLTHARPSPEPDSGGHFTQWVYDVLDTWLIQTQGEETPEPGTTFDQPRVGHDQREGTSTAQGSPGLAGRRLPDHGASASNGSPVS